MINEYGAVGGIIIVRENQNTQKKTCPIPILSTTNPTWPDPTTTN
jgi:hypothetical protein